MQNHPTKPSSTRSFARARVRGRALWQALLGATMGIGLTAALLPHYLVLNRQARDTAGFHNLQQWGIALNLHLSDHLGELPEVGSETVTQSQPKAWYNSLPEYLGQSALASRPPAFRPRPGDKSLWVAPGLSTAGEIPAGASYFGYGMNKFLQLEDGRSRRVTDFPIAGAVVFMTPTSGFVPWVEPQTVATAPRDVTGNVLFCDGHVERVDLATLTAPVPENPANGFPEVTWLAP